LLATGNRLGTYYPAGHILADWLNSNLAEGEEVFRAIETNGSIDNVRLLHEEKIALAMAESRIVKEFFAAQPQAGLRLVWPLWPDVVQLIRAPGLEKSPLEDLSPGFYGQQNSSTFRTSNEIFTALGQTPAKQTINPEQVLVALTSGRIKFAMIQAGIPNRTVSDAVIFHDCSLVDFSDEQRQMLLEQISTAWPVKIPAGYYGEKQPDIRTFGIPNVLIAHEKTSSATIKLVCDLLSRSSMALKIRHQAFADVPADAAGARKILEEIGVPLHQGTLDWFEAHEVAIASDVTEP
jgi:TRAP transporter TAXI family solute receptor